MGSTLRDAKRDARAEIAKLAAVLELGDIDEVRQELQVARRRLWRLERLGPHAVRGQQSQQQRRTASPLGVKKSQETFEQRREVRDRAAVDYIRAHPSATKRDVAEFLAPRLNVTPGRVEKALPPIAELRRLAAEDR